MLKVRMRRRFASGLARLGLSALWLLLCGLIAVPGVAYAGDRGPDGRGNSSMSCSSMYRIEAGDTLSQIAKEYHLTLNELAEYNHIDDLDAIYAGQGICIPPHGMSDEQMYGSVEWSEPRDKDDHDDHHDRKVGGDGYDMRGGDMHGDMRGGDMRGGDMGRDMSDEAMYGSVEWSKPDDEDNHRGDKYGYGKDRGGEMWGGMSGGMQGGYDMQRGPDMSDEAMYGSVEWSYGDDDMGRYGHKGYDKPSMR